jgi:hypothetical protein
LRMGVRAQWKVITHEICVVTLFGPMGVYRTHPITTKSSYMPTLKTQCENDETLRCKTGLTREESDVRYIYHQTHA